jgi:hypothetical protein
VQVAASQHVHSGSFVQVVVVTVRHDASHSADVAEWYRVVPGGPLRNQCLGQLSRPGRLVMNNKDLWQRRRDLEGLQLNVVTAEVSALSLYCGLDLT